MLPNTEAPRNAGLSGYADYKDLTKQERVLLARFAKSKRVRVKLPPSKNNTANPLVALEAARLAQLKHQEELERKRDGHLKKPTQTKMKVNLTGLLSSKSINPQKHGVRPSPPIYDTSAVKRARTSSMASHASSPPPPPLTLGGSMLQSHNSYPDENLYPKNGIQMHGNWVSQENQEPLIVPLPNLTFQSSSTSASNVVKSGNSVVVFCKMPESSKRFSLYICPSANFNETDRKTKVFYKFNPRDQWGGPRRCIVQSHYSGGEWHDGTEVEGMPIEKGKLSEVRITILQTGYQVYVDRKKVGSYPHNFDDDVLEAGRSLFLVIPVKENHYGDPEEVVVNTVWWGHCVG